MKLSYKHANYINTHNFYLISINIINLIIFYIFIAMLHEPCESTSLQPVRRRKKKQIGFIFYKITIRHIKIKKIVSFKYDN